MIKVAQSDKKPIGFLDPNPMTTTQLRGGSQSKEDVAVYMKRAFYHFHTSKKEYVMFPFNTVSSLKSSHWILVVVGLKSNTVWYLDSLSHVKRDYSELISVIDE